MLFQTKYCTSLSNIRLHVVFVSCSSVKHTYWIIHSTETRRSRKYLSCCGLKPIRLLNCYIKQYHTHNHAVVLDVISLKSRRPKIRIHNQSRYWLNNYTELIVWVWWLWAHFCLFSLYLLNKLYIRQIYEVEFCVIIAICRFCRCCFVCFISVWPGNTATSLNSNGCSS